MKNASYYRMTPTRHVRVQEYGIRLDGKHGITGELVAWLTDEQIQSQRDNARKRGNHVSILDLETGKRL